MITGDLMRRARFDATWQDAATTIVLIGPRGSGKSVLMRQWQETHGGFLWPREPQDSLNSPAHVDDADSLTRGQWEELRDWRTLRPQQRLVIACRSARSLPVKWCDVAYVTNLAYTSEEVGDFLARCDSTLDRWAVLRATRGLPYLVTKLVHSGVSSAAAFSAVLAHDENALSDEEAIIASATAITPDLLTASGVRSDLIHDLEADGSGWWLDEPTRTAFVISPAVRAATAALYLRNGELIKRFREDAVRALLREHAWAAAFTEAASLGMFESVEEALWGGGMSLITQEGPLILADLQHVPPRRFVKHPTIALALAIICNSRRAYRGRAAEYLGVALLGSQLTPRGSRERAIFRIVESVARRLRGVGDGGAASAAIAIERLDELREAGAAIGDLAGDMYTQAGISLHYAEVPSLHAFEAALQTFPRANVELLSYGMLALSHELDGDSPAGDGWIEHATSRSWDVKAATGYPGTPLQLALSTRHIERGALAAAKESLTALAGEWETSEFWTTMASVAALIDVLDGSASDGLHRLRALQRRRGQAHLTNRAAEQLVSAEILLLLGSGALDEAQARAAHGRKDGIPPLSAARAHLFVGDAPSALKLISVTAGSTPREQTTSAALLATALHMLERPEAPEVKDHAVSLGRAYSLTTPFLLLPMPGRQLFETAQPDTPLGRATRHVRLTRQEQRLLAELVDTASVSELAKRLFVSVNTVKTHRRSLYRKLDAKNRGDAVASALALGLLGSPQD